MTCKHGHIDAGRYGNGRCRECSRQWQREYARKRRKRVYGYGCDTVTQEQLRNRKALLDDRKELRAMLRGPI